MAGKHPLFLILILSMIGMGDGGSLRAQERTAPPEIDVTTLRVQVKPQLEFVMPLGIVNQAMIIPMGMAQMRSTVGFDIPGALITADVSLRRRFGQWEPELRGAQDLSTGAILDPQIDASGINLGGNADSIVRVRSVGGALRWMPLQTLTCIVDGDIRYTLRVPLDGLSSSETVTEILPEVAIETNQLRVRSPKLLPDATGSFYRFSLGQRFIESLDDPIALHLRIAALWHSKPVDQFRLEQRLSFTTPVYVWDPDRVERLEIGGYESLRGYSPGDISAVRAFLAGNTVLWLAAEDLSIQLGGSKRSVRVHSPRGLIALDAAFTQSEPSLRNPIGFRLGAGPGFSVILSGGGLHFDLRGYLVWPVGHDGLPQVIFRGSLM